MQSSAGTSVNYINLSRIRPGMREIMTQGQTEQLEGHSPVFLTLVFRGKEITSLGSGYVKH